MSKFQRGSMEEQPIQAGASQLFVKLAVAITVVKGNGVARILRVNADLVRTPGHRTAANQRRVRIALFNLKARLLLNILRKSRSDHIHPAIDVQGFTSDVTRFVRG